MADKKNEDFVVRIPDSPKHGFSVEKDPFLRKSSPQRLSRRESLLHQFYAKIDNSPGASILAYCLSSISMTVVNKYVVSGSSWNLNFLYLAIQVRSPSNSARPRLGARTDMCSSPSCV
jgi:GDP-mannose transporter